MINKLAVVTTKPWPNPPSISCFRKLIGPISWKQSRLRLSQMDLRDFKSQQSSYLASLAFHRRCEFLSFLALLKHCDKHQHQAAYKVFIYIVTSGKKEITQLLYCIVTFLLLWQEQLRKAELLSTAGQPRTEPWGRIPELYRQNLSARGNTWSCHLDWTASAPKGGGVSQPLPGSIVLILLQEYIYICTQIYTHTHIISIDSGITGKLVHLSFPRCPICKDHAFAG